MLHILKLETIHHRPVIAQAFFVLDYSLFLVACAHKHLVDRRLPEPINCDARYRGLPQQRTNCISSGDDLARPKRDHLKALVSLDLLASLCDVKEALLGGALDLAAVVPNPEAAELILLSTPAGDEDELCCKSAAVTRTETQPG